MSDTTSSFAGTLIISSGGDYANVSGIELIRKLIIRRLSTPLGGFAHLPNYGIGLPLKQPVRPTDLITMKTAIINQCLQEPDVAAANAVLTVNAAAGILQIVVTAVQAATEQTFTVSTNVPLTAGG